MALVRPTCSHRLPVHAARLKSIREHPRATGWIDTDNTVASGAFGFSRECEVAPLVRAGRPVVDAMSPKAFHQTLRDS